MFVLFAIPESLILRRLRTYFNGIHTETDHIFEHILCYIWLFYEQLMTYMAWFILYQMIHSNIKYTSISMVSLGHNSNSLSAVPDSSYKATRTALSRTALDMAFLICSFTPSVLTLILSDEVNSLGCCSPLWANSFKQRYSFSPGRWASQRQIISSSNMDYWDSTLCTWQQLH